MVLPSSPQPAPGGDPGRVAACIVVPCYNEAERLDRSAMLALADEPGLHLLFVDDGSTDATAALLDELAGRSPYISVLHLPANCGKGEAVRRGLLAAVGPHGPGAGATLTGYYDADLATPPSELLRLVDQIASSPGTALVAGARYGVHAEVQRKLHRRLAGNAYAHLARRALGVKMHDTQCGAKVLRIDDRLRGALARPFLGRWSFDIELIDRLLSGGPGCTRVAPHAIVEVPLVGWHEVGGSKLRTTAMASALLQVVRLGIRRGWRSRPVLVDVSDRTNGWDQPAMALYTPSVETAP